MKSRRRVNSDVILLPITESIDRLFKRIYITSMAQYKKEKVDEMVLALLHLTSSRAHDVVRAWKSHDWDALDRLHQKGYISDPKGKSKSVVLSEEGARLSEELFQRFCGS